MSVSTQKEISGDWAPSREKAISSIGGPTADYGSKSAVAAMIALCILVTNQLLLRIPRRLTIPCLIFFGSESDLRESGIYKPTANHGFFGKSAVVVGSRAIYHFRSRFPRIEVRSAGKQYPRLREIPEKWPFPGNERLRRTEARVARKRYLP